MFLFHDENDEPKKKEKMFVRWIVVCLISIYAFTRVSATDHTHFDDRRLRNFITTRSSIAQDITNIMRHRDENKKNLPKAKHSYTSQRDSILLAPNLDSRYPVLKRAAEPKLLRDINHRRLSGELYALPVNVEAEIVTPKSPKNLTRLGDATYHCVTEDILNEYL